MLFSHPSMPLLAKRQRRRSCALNRTPTGMAPHGGIPFGEDHANHARPRPPSFIAPAALSFLRMHGVLPHAMKRRLPSVVIAWHPEVCSVGGRCMPHRLPSSGRASEAEAERHPPAAAGLGAPGRTRAPRPEMLRHANGAGVETHGETADTLMHRIPTAMASSHFGEIAESAGREQMSPRASLQPRSGDADPTKGCLVSC